MTITYFENVSRLSLCSPSLCHNSSFFFFFSSAPFFFLSFHTTVYPELIDGKKKALLLNVVHSNLLAPGRLDGPVFGSPSSPPFFPLHSLEDGMVPEI
jgi:hypothetical protein